MRTIDQMRIERDAERAAKVATDAFRAATHDMRIAVVPSNEPANAMEAAEQAFEAALSRLEVAMVEVKGTRERLQMLRDHEQWKRVYAERAEQK